MTVLVLATAVFVGMSTATQGQPAVTYRALVTPTSTLRRQFDDSQLAIVEKLNRADLNHLPRLPRLIAPDVWIDDELGYSPLPAVYPAAQSRAKLLVVELPHQVFGAYEWGRLVRWGPVSSGRAGHETPAGLFHLTWRSVGRHSTIDSDWFLPWYFNFENRLGLSLHEYALPGSPASHACIRLLERDAAWLVDWGDQWRLDANGSIVAEGTAVLVVGRFDFNAPPPWRSLDPSLMTAQLPTTF